MNKKFYNYDEKHKSKISYLIVAGYYLEDEEANNDEMVEHNEESMKIIEKALSETLKNEGDEDILELVEVNNNKENYTAVWYCPTREEQDQNGYIHIEFEMN